MSEPSESHAIRIEKLTVKYRGKAAVAGLNLRVPRGAVYALLGDNGAGKSTTMKVLTGQVPPDAGRAEILGFDTWAKAADLRHRVGYVPDRPKLYDWMTVAEMGWFAAAFHLAGFKERYLDWAAKLGLDPNKRLKDLSKGGYARVGLALALSPDPEVLLLDEPTSGLDLRTRREFLGSLVELAAEGRTILISSHSISELERFVSHAAFVKDGHIPLAATLDELRGRFRRVGFRAVGPTPDLSTLGRVLESTRTGRSVQYLIQDPDTMALEALRESSSVTDFDDGPVPLEDIYGAYMAPIAIEGTAFRPASARTPMEVTT